MSPPEACLTLERVEVIAAGDAPSADEQSHLDTCASCAELLDGVRADNALFASALGAIAEAPAVDRSMDAPEGYVFIEEIHRGAQGVVYLAEQLAAKRRVAVKLTLRGAFASMRQRARFDREVELAASLKHPSIVTVYESGATPSGGRYMAMEYVEGLPLDRWFESRDRDPRAVAEVMAALADALDAAHRRGVIHRDLKPSNVLVDSSGTPKVVDFGIAKNVLGDQETQTLQGEFVGTLAYASPEQVTGEPEAVDTRADVYALGALLYEGLTGERPVKLSGSLATSIRAIQDLDPVVPSAVSVRLGEDLDAICLRALEKDPRDRYQSARELCDELRRYLAGEAVLARSDDVWYRTKKWARKRRKRIALVSMAVVAATIGVGLFTQARVAERTAEAERVEGRRVFRLLISPLEAMDTETSNEAVTSLIDYLRRIDSVLQQESPEDPELEAQFRTAFGLALARESLFNDAERQLRMAHGLWAEARGTGSPRVAQASHDLARTYWKSGEYDKAEPLYRQALDTLRGLGEAYELQAARTAHHLASTLERLGQFDEALQLYDNALTIRRARLGPNAPEVANTLNGMGECYSDARRFEEALVRYEESQRIITEAVGADDWRSASALGNVGNCLIELGRTKEAEHLLEQALEISRTWWPEDDPRIVRARLALGRVRGERALVGELVANLANRLGEDHIEVAKERLEYAQLLLDDGEWDAAYTTALRASRQLDGHSIRWRAGHAKLLMAEALEGLGRAGEAGSVREEAQRLLADSLSADDPLRTRAGGVTP